MQELKNIYNLLKDGEIHTSEEISSLLNVSNKTARKYVSELKDILEKYCINIISKPSKGYILDGEILSESIIFKDDKYFIDTSEKRIEYLAYYLLTKEKYIKIEELSNLIYVSTKTTSFDLKELEKKILKYNLKFDRKPYYGIKITGSEIDIRNFIVDLFNGWLNENKFNKILEEYLGKYNFEEAYNFFKSRGIRISDISFKSLILSIVVTLKRVEEGKNIKKIDVDKDNLFYEKRKIIINFFDYLYPFNKLNDKDIDYVTIRFLIAETLNYEKISKNINDLNDIISEMIKYINLTFQIELDENKQFYENLYTHLYALIIRIRFCIKIENPLLEEIMNNMKFEYNIASYLGSILEKKYKKRIPNEEIGYLAVILHMGIESNKKKYVKKNLLIVCPSGRGISKFLIHTYQNMFSTYTNSIKTCGVKELKYIDLSQIDIIFTLVDISEEIKNIKPVYKIKYFLQESDLEEIKRILKDEKDNLKLLIPPDLFIYLEEKMDKNQIIKLMSEKLKKIKNMPENTYDLILEREKLGMTEISENIAIPHCIEVIENVNVLGVVICKHRVKWNNNKVNLIFFMCFDNEENNNEFIYNKIIKLVDDEEKLNNILKAKSYEKFISLFQSN